MCDLADARRGLGTRAPWYTRGADFGDLIEHPSDAATHSLHAVVYRAYSQIKLLNRLQRASTVYYDLCVPIKVVVARAPHYIRTARVYIYTVAPDRHLTLFGRRLGIIRINYIIVICVRLLLLLLLSTRTHIIIIRDR